MQALRQRLLQPQPARVGVPRALEQTEQRMTALSAEKAALEARLATPLPPADLADAGRRLKAVGDELHQLEEQWLALSGEIETASAL